MHLDAPRLKPFGDQVGGAVLLQAQFGVGVDIVADGDIVRLALFADNSAVRQLGGSCTILVPTEQGPLRVSLQPAVAREAVPLAVIEGHIVSMRLSHEPPWSLRLDFLPAEEEGREAFVEYWTRVRSWLEQGAQGEGPQPPDVR